MSINLTKIAHWLGNIFKTAKNDIDLVAIAITQGLKETLNSGLLPDIATIVDVFLKTHVMEYGVAILNANINKIIAIELAIHGFPDNPTAEELEAFSKLIIHAFSDLSDIQKSKFYTSLAAQISTILTNSIQQDRNISFAKLVSLIEEAYQEYQKDVLLVH